MCQNHYLFRKQCRKEERKQKGNYCYAIATSHSFFNPSSPLKIYAERAPTKNYYFAYLYKNEAKTLHCKCYWFILS